jgi:hypothetical protein
MTNTERSIQPTTTPIAGAASPAGPAHGAPAEGPWQSTQPGVRFAALVDIENAAIVNGLLLPAPLRSELLHVLSGTLTGMPVRVATGTHVLKASMTDLPCGWGLSLVPTVPDAADLALIEAGLQFAACGVTDLVVVSGDHAFVTLAPHARLHVISRPRQLSNALRLAATTVTYLPALQALTPASATA